MYRLVISIRYLLHKRICILAMLGVAVGVMALLVTHSVMTGFEQNIRQRIRGALSDLIIEQYGEEYFGDYKPLMEKLSRLEHVQACSPHLDGLALIKLGRRDEYRYAQFVGIDLERELQVSNLADYWRNVQEARKKENAEYEIIARPTWEGPRQAPVEVNTDEDASDALSPAIVGNELVVRGQNTEGKPVKLKPGDEIVMVTATSAFERGILPCRITDMFKSGMYEYDQRNIYIPLEKAQQFLEKEGKLSAIHVRLDDYARAHEVRAAILGIPTLEELVRLRRLLHAALRQADSELTLPDEGIFRELQDSYYKWRDTGNPKHVRASDLLLHGYAALARRLRANESLGGFSGAGQLEGLLGKLRDRCQDALSEWHAVDIRTLERRKLPAPYLSDAFFRWASAASEQRSIFVRGELHRVSTWEDKRRNFLRAIDVERILIVIILSFFFLLGGFTIYAILSAMVLEKIKDVGTLKSLGTTVGGIMSIFLLNGLVIGLVGSVLGTLGGVLFCRHINGIAELLLRVTGRTMFPRDIYYLDQIPVDQNPLPWIVVIACAAVASSVLASLLPAFRAARLDPVEALRYE